MYILPFICWMPAELYIEKFFSNTRYGPMNDTNIPQIYGVDIHNEAIVRFHVLIDVQKICWCLLFRLEHVI